MEVCAIVAMDKNRVIGKDNDIPWKLKADMKWFKFLTGEHVVIMGRKTWDSFPEQFKPLPNRYNIIVTSKPQLLPTDVIIFATNSLDDALSVGMFQARRKKQDKVFVIGGASLYNAYLDRISTHYITLIDTEVVGGDTFYPDFNVNLFNSAMIAEQEPDSKNEYGFKIYEFTRKAGNGKIRSGF